jgi:hypothetical protein
MTNTIAPVVAPKNVRFCHVRAESDITILMNQKREFTVAYDYNPATNEFFAAFAYCSLKDPYNRKIGNQIAANRLAAGMNGQELESQYYLPIHNATLFNSHREMLQFAIVWGKQFN